MRLPGIILTVDLSENAVWRAPLRLGKKDTPGMALGANGVYKAHQQAHNLLELK